MTGDILYSERTSSTRTTLLFIALTLIFFILFKWRANMIGLDFLAGVLAFFFVLFLFYTLNYRFLLISITRESLKLTFGIFHWTVPLSNIASYALDELPAFKKYGGAGIHFMMVNERYRASFNFLEYPRIVLALKRKQGSVQDVSFSTRHPDEVLQTIRKSIVITSEA